MKKAALSALTLLMVAVADASACVGCRVTSVDSVVNEPQTVTAGFGFSWGVLIMLACALSVVGGLVVYIWRTVVKLDAAHSDL
ncbi:MAG: hypothetical protein Fur0032_18310 [Terrimicrobiaceae bacterium]